jgi:hypothetical protein
VPEARRCSVDQPQICDASGHWTTAGSTCPYVCSGGRCTGTCRPGARRCNGSMSQTCDSGGTWRDAVPCTACVMDGVCSDCSPGARSCAGNQPILCDASGHFVNSGPACTATACVGGACTQCAPNTTQCKPGDNRTLQTCNAQGNWQDALTCDTRRATPTAAGVQT